jgi:hypothetical protein
MRVAAAHDTGGDTGGGTGDDPRLGRRITIETTVTIGVAKT